MTIQKLPAPRHAAIARDARHAVGAAVRTASDALAAAGPTCGYDTAANALAHARAASEHDDGTGGRAAAAIRTAWAHLGAGQVEDAFLALEFATPALDEQVRP